MNTQDKWFLAIGGVGVVAGIYFLSRSAKAKPSIAPGSQGPYIDQKYPGEPTPRNDCQYKIQNIYTNGGGEGPLAPQYQFTTDEQAIAWFMAQPLSTMRDFYQGGPGLMPLREGASIISAKLIKACPTGAHNDWGPITKDIVLAAK